jgi:hypothetical protein
MKKIKGCVYAITLIWLFSIPLTAGLQWTLDIESGYVMSGYNNIQIPPDTGTRFSLKNDLNIHGKIYDRIRLNARFGRKHALSLLYAPLSLKADGTLEKPVVFEGVEFPNGSTVNALFRFNSYRLTYRYRLFGKPKLDLWLGFTAKIRDAEIRITSGPTVSSKANVGFVPLLHLLVDWKWSKKSGLLFDADAAAAKQGRAEDVSAALYYNVDSFWGIKGGYRFVEGGADVEEVYNFAFIHYFYVGIVFNF